MIFNSFCDSIKIGKRIIRIYLGLDKNKREIN